MADSTQRFSIRAEAYSRYRPTYPREVLELLQKECGLGVSSTVADIGSGTGLLAELLLHSGCEVIAVEPNREMREAGQRYLAGRTRFRGVDGRAEATSLPDHSVDFVTAAQAFHWFDPTLVRVEFARILKPEGWLVLTWNERTHAETGFQADYDAITLRFAPDFTRALEENIDIAFGGRVWQLRRFPNQQRLDREGLVGRLSSTSYAPAPGTPDHDTMEHELDRLFDRHQQDGIVTLVYETSVYYGRPAKIQ